MQEMQEKLLEHHESHNDNAQLRLINLARFLKVKPKVPLTARIRRQKAKKSFAPNREFSYWLKNEFPKNYRSGITVSLVNVPLSISLAIASGAGPVPGIITAFWGGLLAALFGGSDFNITGPTGALSGLLMAIASIFGGEILPYVAMMAGVMVFAVWYFNLADYMLFIPSSVIHGFTFGVGLIIGLGQMDFALGLQFHHEEQEFFMKVYESFMHVGYLKLECLILFGSQLFLLLFLAKRWKTIPWEIIMAAIGIALAVACDSFLYEDFGIKFVTLHDKFGDLSLNIFNLPVYHTGIFDSKVISTSVSVAFIAILETLISARMADTITKTEHNRDKEVLGVALANVASGIFGGIPATAALARTVLNISAGANSRASAIIGTAALLVIAVLFLPEFLLMPLPTVAAILSKVALRLMDPTHMVHMFGFDRNMFWIAVFTAAASVFLDTTVGLAGGSLISLLLYAKQMSTGHVEIMIYKTNEYIGEVDIDRMDQFKIETPEDLEIDEYSPMMEGEDKAIPLVPMGDGAWATKTAYEKCEKADLLVYNIFGKLNYINDRGHVQRVKKVISITPGCKGIIFNMRSLTQVDLDGIDSFGEMVEAFARIGARIAIAEILTEQVFNAFAEEKYFNRIKSDGMVFETLDDAIAFMSQKHEE
jgi:SulP family sulfate permease